MVHFCAIYGCIRAQSRGCQHICAPTVDIYGRTQAQEVTSRLARCFNHRSELIHLCETHGKRYRREERARYKKHGTRLPTLPDWCTSGRVRTCPKGRIQVRCHVRYQVRYQVRYHVKCYFIFTIRYVYYCKTELSVRILTGAMEAGEKK